MFEKDYNDLSITDIENITDSLLYKYFLRSFGLGVYEYYSLLPQEKEICFKYFYNIRNNINKTLDLFVSNLDPL